MVHVQRCVQGIFLEDNRQIFVCFVFAFGDFNTKMSSFYGSQLT